MLRNAGANNGILLVLVAALAVSHVCAIEEVPFTSLNPAQRNQVVLMYKSGEDRNERALEAVLEAEIALQEAIEFGGLDGADKIVFKKCDAFEGQNWQEMERAGLTQLPMIFVAIDGQGMEKYVREETPTPEKFTDYLITKLEPTSDEFVFPYSEDLITDEYPVLVKFFENWCSRCVAMKKAFENAAARMAGKVIFMEVSCSASDQAQEFCTKHNVDGFPTIKLMGGKLKKALLFERDRSVQTMIEFLKEHVPEALVDKIIEDEQEPGDKEQVEAETKTEL